MNWEYLVRDWETHFYCVDIETKCDSLGREGWRLVSVIPVSCDRSRHYFERPFPIERRMSGFKNEESVVLPEDEQVTVEKI